MSRPAFKELWGQQEDFRFYPRFQNERQRLLLLSLKFYTLTSWADSCDKHLKLQNRINITALILFYQVAEVPLSDRYPAEYLVFRRRREIKGSAVWTPNTPPPLLTYHLGRWEWVGTPHPQTGQKKGHGKVPVRNTYLRNLVIKSKLELNFLQARGD